jgi:hypothetical protein
MTGCAKLSLDRPPPAPAYDVRSATVVADPAVPPVSPVLISSLNDKVNAAIAATTRATPLPQVALTIRLTDVRKNRSFDHDRNSAKINIDAASVTDGSVVALATFDTVTIAPDPVAADNLMAEDIAARIRAIFVLNRPRLVN